MTSIKFRAVAPFALLLAMLLIGLPASAHHSYAMFDGARLLRIEGSVRELQWTNPHIWLELDVTDGPDAGRWSFEGGPIAQLKNIGWSRNTLKPGDRITVATHPLQNGNKGGALMWIMLPDGKTLQGGGTVAQKTVPDIVEH